MYFSVADMFSYKKVTEDLIEGLEELGEITGAEQVKDEIKHWKKDLKEWSEVNYDRIEQVQYFKIVFDNSF